MCVPVYVFLKVTEWFFFKKNFRSIVGSIFVYSFMYWNKSPEIVYVVKTPGKITIVQTSLYRPTTISYVTWQ